MPRTPDPTRLDDEEADAARDIIAAVKRLKKLTNEGIAERLGWDVRQVTAVSDRTRALHAEKAYQLIRAMAEMPPNRGPGVDRVRADQELLQFWHKASWVDRYKARERAPAVVIPPFDYERFAHRLVEQIATTPDIKWGPARKRNVTNALVRFFKATSPKMSRTWLDLTASRVAIYAENAASGKIDWLNPVPAIRVLDVILKPPAKPTPSFIARESLFAAVAMPYIDVNAAKKKPTKRGGPR